MRSKSNRLFSVAMLVALCLSSVSFAIAAPDEGMYTPGQIASLPLKARGLKIKPTDIYNPAGGGLTDAVIRLSIGCTAEFVSPEGLILTNHHCAFDALVKASTPEKDIVEHGFKADNRGGEIPAQGYSIFITERTEDVTSRIRSGTNGLSGEALAAALKKNVDALQAEEDARKPAGTTIRIAPINSGFYYHLYQTREIKDIRIVYAPPRNIGVFGGDPDNFEWPRHTGDFAFLRAYVAPDGSAAAHSPNNVPYKPKRFLTMNIGGLKDGEFVFVLGYPGSTTRYRESWSIEYARDANFPFLAKWLNALSTSLQSIGEGSEEKRIAFQSNIANFDNARKVYEGGALRLQRARVAQQRQAEEAKLASWIAQNPDRQRRYGTVLNDLRTLSEETNAAAKRDAMMRRFPDTTNATPISAGLVLVGTAIKQGRKLEPREVAAITAALAEPEPAHEREMLKFFFKAFDELPAGQKLAAADSKFAGKAGADRRQAEAEFAAEIADSGLTAEKIIAMQDMSWADFESRHPFFAGVVTERTALMERTNKFNAAIDHLRLNYMQAMAEMRGTQTVYPDANSTLRFAYGNVKGYQPREAEIRMPFTTLKGKIEKDTGVEPFDVPQKLKDLQAARDFGRWGEGDSVVLNFLSTTDIIGGNSGSPILNGNGEQVGLCFDGNFEGLGNDFYYDPDFNRTISVDIRYVLFITEKFGGAGWILNEMRLVGGSRGRA